MDAAASPSPGSGPAPSRLRPAPAVGWAVEMHGLLLRGPGGTRTVHYPAAAVWDLVARGYPLERVVALTGHIAGLEEEGARALVKDALREWLAAGYLEEVPGDG